MLGVRRHRGNIEGNVDSLTAPVESAALASTEVRGSRGRIKHDHVNRGLSRVDRVLQFYEVLLKASQIVLAIRTFDEVVHGLAASMQWKAAT